MTKDKKQASPSATTEKPKIGVKEGGKIVTKVALKKGVQAVAKVAAKKVSELSPKLIEKIGIKTTQKTGSKLASKSLAKAMPFASLGVGSIFAAGRARKGDFVGASLEFTSGALACIPVYGTASSLGIDAYIIARDLGRQK